MREILLKADDVTVNFRREERQQPVEALGARTARGLFLWRSMARPRVLRGVILGLPFCSALIGYSVGSTFSS